MKVYNLNLDSIIDNSIIELNKRINQKNDCFIIDTNYYNDVMSHDFTDGIKIIRNDIYQKKIILFIQSITNRINAGEDADNLMITTQEFKDAFDTKNYTVAKDFLIDIGFLRRNIIDYNGGNIQYFKAPKADQKGIVTRYTVQLVTKWSTWFTLIQFPAKKKGKDYINIKVDVDPVFKETLLKTRIDKKSAIKDEYQYFINNTDENRVTSFYKRINRVLNYGDSIYTTRGQKSKRIFHSLSNLSSVSRKHLTIYGQSFSNVDLKNSQILFLVTYCRKNNLGLDNNFVNDVQDGVVYDRFYYTHIDQKETYFDNGHCVTTHAKYNIGFDRKKVKQELFRSIFFSWKEHFSLNKKFKELYPETWITLNKIHQSYKGNKQTNLSILLQNEEFYLFNDIHLKLKSDGYFNLFDAIYYTDDIDTDTIVSHIRDYFYNLEVYKISITINDADYVVEQSEADMYTRAELDDMAIAINKIVNRIDE